MPFAYHPNLEASLAALTASGITPPGFPPPIIPRGDWKKLRVTTEAMMSMAVSIMPLPPGISTTDYSVISVDGAPIRLRRFVKEGSAPGSAAIYVHGGGMIMCNLDLYMSIYMNYVAASGVPILGIDFRNAPDVPGSTLAEDNFAALTWLLDHAEELGVDPARIALMGESGSPDPDLPHVGRPERGTRPLPGALRKLVLRLQLHRVDSGTGRGAGQRPRLTGGCSSPFNRLRRAAADLHRHQRAGHFSGRGHGLCHEAAGRGHPRRLSSVPGRAARLGGDHPEL
jgi:hypothetical protein